MELVFACIRGTYFASPLQVASHSRKGFVISSMSSSWVGLLHRAHDSDFGHQSLTSSLRAELVALSLGAKLLL
jgi:hypothetical protein